MRKNDRNADETEERKKLLLRINAANVLFVSSNAHLGVLRHGCQCH